MEEFYFTEGGLEKLKKELQELKTVRRKEIIERIKETRNYGDLAENSEYADAKNEQAFIEGRITELENIIKKAKIIQKSKCDRVALGCKVRIRAEREEEEFVFVGSGEIDPEGKKISFDSPLGRALQGKKVGEVLEVETPGGIIKYEIIKIK